MPTNTVKGFNVNGSTVQYDYESLADRILKSSIANEYSNMQTYSVGDYVLYEGQLYKCTIDVITPQDFDNNKWVPISTGSELKSLSNMSGLTNSIKQALLDCFEHVAWVDEHGQTYYDALEAALYPLDHITAVYTQSGTVYDTDSLDSLKTDLVVTAVYEGGNTETVPAANYTLSGTLTVGTSTITVTCGGKTATFDVVVTEAPLLPTEYQQVEYIANPSDAYFVTNVAVPLGYKLHAKAFWTAKGSAGQSVCGGGNNGYNRSLFFYSTTDDRVGCWYGNINNFVEVLGYTSEPVEVETVMTSSNISINAKNSRSENTKTTNVSATRTNPLEVFRTSEAAPGNFVGRIYFIEVLSLENIATAKLIPCYRKADNVVGMYDVVNNVFYSSANSTAFTKGGNV